MTSPIEQLALGAVAIVLIISIVQAVQLSGLNEKVAEQNTALASLASSGNLAGTASQSSTPNATSGQTNSAASPQMVGGC